MELFKQATEFIEMMYDELNLGSPAKRLNDIKKEINETSLYTHTSKELEYGARVAWRNSNRCIGRLYWEKLVVRDERHIDNEEDFVESIETHINDATNGGKIVPMISVYSNDIKLYNEQLIRYAGYDNVGDPRSIEATKQAEKVGWKKEPDDFNILPLIYRVKDGDIKYHEYREGLIKEVNIEHHDYPKLKDLGLKWYAVPIICNMDLEIGGIYYHTPPFNGWYMETEIAVRNFTDDYRYNKLESIAEALELDMSKTTTYWRDRALVEISYAVYHSFRDSKVTMVDHITASKQFKTFERLEKEAGRTVTGKWSWLAPPLSPSLTHNYHYGFDNTTRSPNFLYRENKCPVH